MIKTILCFLAVACLAVAASAPKEEKEVLAAMDVFKNALINKDGAALEKLLSPDLAYVHSGGQFQTKAEVIDSVVKGKAAIERLDFSDTSVRIYGNTALVRGRVELWHNKNTVIPMNILHVWVNGANGWQLVSRQATRLPK